MGSFPYPRNGILKIDYEFILIFKKPGKAPIPDAKQKKTSEITKEEWNTFFASHWNFGGAKQDGHIAVFPEELPHRLIKMFSFTEETIFDPFMGSGTTALAARNLQRNSIGYEINSEFKKYYEEKVAFSLLAVNADFKYYKDDTSFDLVKKMKNLPYLFRDPHKMGNKIDIKKLQFGSRIDKEKKEREKYFSVKNILTPNTLVLDNGLTIRLLGIMEKPAVNGRATQFLAEKTKGHKVFLRYDKIMYDDNDILLCYLYLDNKTFINAHILKNGLADVDYSYDFKYKNKFEKLINL